MLLNCMVIGCGGFVGSILRYLASTLLPSSSFPWATLLVNVVGSFALAAIAGLATRGIVSNEQVSLMLRVGLCGGFTTMSTFSFEVMGLASRENVAGALAYALLTCALCVAASFAGTVAVRA